ncbi:hypothetical protein DFQ30_001147, partial [Apophysomyces sp. BC1015]
VDRALHRGWIQAPAAHREVEVDLREYLRVLAGPFGLERDVAVCNVLAAFLQDHHDIVGRASARTEQDHFHRSWCKVAAAAFGRTIHCDHVAAPGLGHESHAILAQPADLAFHHAFPDEGFRMKVRMNKGLDGEKPVVRRSPAQSGPPDPAKAALRCTTVVASARRRKTSSTRRQRRLRVDDTWFRVDRVFFHRRLKCLVIIDLKHWMTLGENPPVGLILCAEKGTAEAHYALDNLPNKILAAEYQTVLPDETLIAKELERTRAELERRRTSGDPGA